MMQKDLIQSIDDQNTEGFKISENPEKMQDKHPASGVNHLHQEYASFSMEELLNDAEKLIKTENIDYQIIFEKFRKIKAAFYKGEEKIARESNASSDNVDSETIVYRHPLHARFHALVTIFKEKQDIFRKKREKEEIFNLQKRREIIDRLRHLYTNTESGINLFKSIREIKEDWGKAGQVAASHYKTVTADYFHHLDQFYKMMDMSKEYLEQEYAHNLEKRHHIILRAKELLLEPLIKKALNELQYLHKLWKEEAEPVAEKYRESTWQTFKEISAKVHDRKTELQKQIEDEQNENLEKKNKIIARIKEICEVGISDHSHLQKTVKEVENLRNDFIILGGVPKKFFSENWSDFKVTLRNFNSLKNSFYKKLKENQSGFLNQKIQLLETAKANKDSEDWENVVSLFRKLQQDWKKIGHVPGDRSRSVWIEFRESCDYFFERYHRHNSDMQEIWIENFNRKKSLLQKLQELEKKEEASEIVSAIKSEWNSIGKVPKNEIGINSEFNKVLIAKLKLNNIDEYDLDGSSFSEESVKENIKKIKKNIRDLETETIKLENNLSFFSNHSAKNPLLSGSYEKIASNKEKIENLKNRLKYMVHLEKKQKKIPKSNG